MPSVEAYSWIPTCVGGHQMIKTTILTSVSSQEKLIGPGKKIPNKHSSPAKKGQNKISFEPLKSRKMNKKATKTPLISLERLYNHGLHRIKPFKQTCQ